MRWRRGTAGRDLQQYLRQGGRVRRNRSHSHSTEASGVPTVWYQPGASDCVWYSLRASVPHIGRRVHAGVPDHGNSDDSTDFAKCRTFPASDITVRNFAGGSVNLAGWGDYHPVPVYRNHNVAAGDLIRRDTADSVTLDWNYTVSANYPVSWSSDPEYASTGDRDRAPGTFIGWDFADPDDPDGHHSEPAVCDFSRSSDPGDAGSGNCNRTPPAPDTGSSADPSGPSGDSLRAAVSDHIRYSDHFNDPVRTDLSHPDPDRHDPGIILRSCRCRDVDRLAGCRL